MRLDKLLVQRNLVRDLETARAVIGAGRVLVDDQVADKAGWPVSASCRLFLKQPSRYVSRGGRKLEEGLRRFGLDVRGYICADIGCSTGGFTDCLLQHGAARVYSVDVGYGVLDWRLRNDPRVIVLERTNARFLSGKDISRPLDLVVIDASFISLSLLLPPVLPLFADQARILALVKPQFELARNKVAKGGVVRDSALHEEAVAKVRQAGEALGLTCRGSVRAPIRGAKGNQEFLIYFVGENEQ